MTLGKLFTPSCLDVDSFRYCMESLNWVPLPFRHRDRHDKMLGHFHFSYRYITFSKLSDNLRARLKNLIRSFNGMCHERRI